MKVKALDTIRVSSAGGRKEQGEEFEVSDHEGAQLIARGLVSEIKSKKVSANKAMTRSTIKAAK